MQWMKVEELPLEIIVEILSRLPEDSILECKLVCKTWRTLIDNTSSTVAHCRLSNSAAEEADEAQPLGFFVMILYQLHYGECYKQEEEEEEAHFKFTKPLKYPPLPCHPYYNITNWAILGSSNGLICLSACRFNGWCECDVFTYNIYVYNPMTREFVDVGTETHMGAAIVDGGGGFRASGFGYHPSTKEYKVVRINYKTNLSHSGQVRVYTLGSGSWRDIVEIPYVIKGVTKPGVLINGALYWRTLDGKILSFDLEYEEFRIVPRPWERNRHYGTRLGVLRGCLSAETSAVDHTDVWIMNNNKLYMSSSSSRTTDDEPSWTRLTIALDKPPGGGYRINDRWAFNRIFSYGIEYKSFGRFLYSHLCKRGFDQHNLHLVPYKKSFVSLEALGEENVKKIC